MNSKILVLAGVFGALIVGCGDDTTGTGGSAAGGNGTGGATTTTGGNSGTGGTASTGGNAGTGGGMTGPATCADYCATITAACTAGNQQYASAAACEAECASYAAGTVGAMSGDNLECRAYHAGVAATTDAAIHCVHAGPLGSGPTAMAGCTTDHASRCTAYCNVAEEICAGEATYAFANGGFDACNTACNAFPDTNDFNTGVASGATLACAMYHLSVAADGGQAVHCAHTDGSACGI